VRVGGNLLGSHLKGLKRALVIGLDEQSLRCILVVYLDERVLRSNQLGQNR